ncbi:DUF4191 domain-containing protein [Ornithinicoccus halotolerans]|uniref:DUF4191 domain-containing protein n=1 Tax=Ornithinicoccus halotolerans TaxID=1748220 RepID=UPI001885D2BC|nr:DUF4191 domain-containing protein [Ornithinicoccus halotolerans]
MASTDSSSSEEPKRRFGRRTKKQRDPNNPGRLAQIRQVFQMTRRNDPASVWWMALAFFGIILVALLVGLWLDLVIYCLLIGIPLAVLAAVAILGRRAERAAFTQIEGQPGAPAAVLGSLRRGWFYEQEPVAAESGGKVRGMRDLQNAAMVYRAVGRPGVVLITEGPRGSAQRLAKAEQRKVTRVVGPEVPVHTLHVGKGDQDVPLHKLTKRLKRFDKKISKQEAIVVHRRLQALGRQAKPPVPAGMDPRKARVDRRALRGR